MASTQIPSTRFFGTRTLAMMNPCTHVTQRLCIFIYTYIAPKQDPASSHAGRGPRTPRTVAMHPYDNEGYSLILRSTHVGLGQIRSSHMAGLPYEDLCCFSGALLAHEPKNPHSLWEIGSTGPSTCPQPLRRNIRFSLRLTALDKLNQKKYKPETELSGDLHDF